MCPITKLEFGGAMMSGIGNDEDGHGQDDGTGGWEEKTIHDL